MASTSDRNIFIQGKTLNSHVRTIIFNVFNYLKESKYGDSNDAIIKETSEATGVSYSTCRRIIVDRTTPDSEEIIRTPGKKRPKISTLIDVDEFDLFVIWATVSEIFRENKCPTVTEILVRVREKINYKGSERSLRRIMKNKFHFKYGKIDNRSFFIERSDVVAHRHRYLQQIHHFREKLSNFVYLDETWVNENHSKQKQWHDNLSVKGRKLPLGKGRRLILLHAGGEGGFIQNAKLLFRSGTNSENYHDEMDGNKFKHWFQSQLLPNIPNNSVIIMDNAPYHSMLQEKLPTSTSRKAEMIEWLNCHGISCSLIMLKHDLYEIVKQHKKEKQRYVIDEIASQNGHSIIRLPPYHCDLNPIELIWAQVKEDIRRENTTFKLNDVEKLIDSAIIKVSSTNWQKCIDHVIKLEKLYWETDGIIEQQVESLIINATENSSDSDSEVSDVGCLSS